MKACRSSRTKNTDYSGWLVVEAEQDPTKAPALEAVTRANQFVKSLTGLNQS